MNLTPVDFKAVAAKGYYLYVYLRQDELTPYYVGLSCNHRRPTDPDHCVDVPEDFCRIRVLRSGLTKEQAETWEQFYIFWYGRKSEGGCLRNLRAGGSTGSTGYKHTAEAKAKFAQRVWSAEVTPNVRPQRLVAHTQLITLPSLLLLTKQTLKAVPLSLLRTVASILQSVLMFALCFGAPWIQSK